MWRACTVSLPKAGVSRLHATTAAGIRSFHEQYCAGIRISDECCRDEVDVMYGVVDVGGSVEGRDERGLGGWNECVMIGCKCNGFTPNGRKE